MKKSIFSIMAISAIILGMSSCRKDKVELGSVSLDPQKKEVHYGEKYEVKAVFSEKGEAKSKSYKWSSSADSIATVEKVQTKSAATVTPKRIGEANIICESTDGLIKTISRVVVKERSILLNGIYFSKNADASSIKKKMLRNYKFDENASSSDVLIFNNENESDDIPTLIYELENDRLKVLNVILKNDTEVEKDALNYMEERFRNTEIGKMGVTYYQSTTAEYYPVNTVMGLFKDDEIDGLDQTFPLGVRIADYSYIK